MPAVCLYFQVHQPYRLRPFSYFDIGTSAEYFDEALNRSVMERVAERCYVPANSLLLELIKQFKGAFRVAFSISGVTVEQMRRYAPKALESFQALAASGSVEFLAETYYHSLASIYDGNEFAAQIQLHQELMKREFLQSSQVFRNTELLYSDEIGRRLASLGMRGVIVEGADHVLNGRSPHVLYAGANLPLTLITRSYQLSDDIAFRYMRGGLDGKPLSVDRYSEKIHCLDDVAQAVGIFVDYETFGEHVGQSLGILEFLRALPEKILTLPAWHFATPSELVARPAAGGALSFVEPTSWADTERDTSAWMGNEMQRKALTQLYELGGCIPNRSIGGDSEELCIWRRLQTSDHFYYMATKAGGDGVVHAHFSPFESPYRAFIAYSNVLRDFAARLGARG